MTCPNVWVSGIFLVAGASLFIAAYLLNNRTKALIADIKAGIAEKDRLYGAKAQQGEQR
jgi:hypothetical protein